ncbi:5-histidylcysteine sulfoxide synthase [Salinimonas sp. HHU 13199]|uniref:5-histidylcysteine sulfoxide synthase n=1 Tax=Salinimonas profundi TaxID=2729140 RepID=A0ABR8LDP9_9ALTE|nr:5-histidylcysteine sulfoxide synthase [Salinimonas profundi]MBD3584425.1 5-histidylcysteine sulfoxide synthase [Salinimonas profundi]
MRLLHTPHLRAGSVEKKREEILAYFENTSDTYESLFSNLKNDDAFYERPEPLRHPLIFYYGHTATFFINKLMLAKQLNDRVNPDFESLFAVGVDEMSWDDLNDENYHWPTVDEVRTYRQAVRQLVTDLIKTQSFTMPIDWDSPMWPILMGIEHERIHLETSSVLIRQLALEHISPQPAWRASQVHHDAPHNNLLPVDTGVVENNKHTQSEYYGWDNEYGEQREEVSAFKASQYLVSNAEFLSFVEEGGYATDKYWEEEGLAWRQYTQATHPVFWRKTDNGFRYRAMTEEMPLPLSWPADVNYHEAKAYCHWLSEKQGKPIRLPTENEWQRLRDTAGFDEALFDEGMNINLNKAASSEPVDINRHGEFYDVAGNVWQWTETPIYPFDGFRVHPLYDDFTTPTFDNKHNLIKGGSWASTGNEATCNSRYAFRRHFFQHAGFRYVESPESITVNDFDYESDTQVSQYSEFHYGDSYFGVPNFAKASAERCLSYMDGKPAGKALDLGCAVGRSAFELARRFEHVDAIDFSARFIKTAFTMQERGEIRYHLIDEGELTTFKSRKLADMGLAPYAKNVHFAQGDACNLKPQYTGYDLIFMGNLLDRVYSPRKLLKDIQERLNAGGILVIASPFTWLTEYTEREEWLGGYKESTGESLSSTDALDRVLDKCKRIDGPQDVEFVIRETKRKFQHSVSEFNIFEKHP